MSRSPSPTSRLQSSPNLLLNPQSTPQTPDFSLRRFGSTASSTFSPFGVSLDDTSRNGRDGAYATLNRPASKMEMNEGDEETLLGHSRNHSHHSVKHYEQMESWVGLLRAGTIKFLMTLFFGGILCLCLKAWEGFRSSIPLSKYDVRIFNALTIAISICLGLNLLASLKRYAVILRWSILTRYWVPLEVFDLILGIDELTNVAKLFVLSVPALQQQKWLMGTSRPWKNAKKGTKRRFATVCLIWLLINIGSQVLVASLSLFWPMEPYKCPLTKYGTVAVADLSRWSEEEEAVSTTPWKSYEAAWRYGLEAQSWSNFSVNDKALELSQLPGTPIYRGYRNYEYRFYYRNPESLYSDFLQSNRSIKSEARCKEYNIRGNLTEFSDTKTAGWRISAGLPKKKTIQISIPTYGAGMITWQSLTEVSCGPRCTQLTVYQAEGESGEIAEKVNRSSLWKCENTITKVEENREGASHPGIKYGDTHIYGTDQFAKVAAGAIGWTGFWLGGWRDRQWRLYTQGTPWSPERVLNTSDVEEIIMRFSIGAIASFDDHGIRHKIKINNKICKETSQKLNVSWRYVSSILGVIGLIQFSALCFLLIRANRSIVRDASFFSTAMLLRPILKELDDEPGRMVMSGAEIVNHEKFRDRNVRYDYKELRHGEVKQVTVYFEDEFQGGQRKRWPSGNYGG